jgi:hypothetical protein
MPQNRTLVNDIFSNVKEKYLISGKEGFVTCWDKKFCTAGGVHTQFTPKIVMEKSWCPAIVRDGYRHSDNFISAQYLVINFLSDVDTDRLYSVFGKYKHIYYSAIVNDNHRCRFVLKYKHPVDLKTYKQSHHSFYEKFNPSVVDRSSSPVQSWSPGYRIIHVGDGELLA